MVDQALADQFGEELGFGGYGGEFRVGHEDLVMTCDGVGTKLHIAEYLQIYDTIGIDLVAMCANDLICMGAEPVGFMDYYAVDKLDLEKSHQILDGIKKGCRQAGCALLGGETAQLSNLFRTNNQFDLAGFMVGHKRFEFDKRPIKAGDLLVGIESSGVHSNGFTDIRHHWAPDEYKEWMLTPTRMYVNAVLHNTQHIKACAHITGGGLLGNIPRALPDDVAFDLGCMMMSEWWQLFGKAVNMSEYQMMNTYNCGYGMVLVVDKNLNFDDLEIHEGFAIIGEVVG